MFEWRFYRNRLNKGGEDASVPAGWSQSGSDWIGLRRATGCRRKLALITNAPGRNFPNVPNGPARFFLKRALVFSPDCVVALQNTFPPQRESQPGGTNAQQRLVFTCDVKRASETGATFPGRLAGEKEEASSAHLQHSFNIGCFREFSQVCPRSSLDLGLRDIAASLPTCKGVHFPWLITGWSPQRFANTQRGGRRETLLSKVTLAPRVKGNRNTFRLSPKRESERLQQLPAKG